MASDQQIRNADENASYVLAYNGSDQLETVTKTVNGTVYVLTLTWTGSNLTAASTWVKQ